MTLQAMADNGLNISSQIDARILSALKGQQDYVLPGIGNAFACTATGLVVTMTSGQGSIMGRFVSEPLTSNVTVPANTSGFIVIRLDLTGTAGSEATLKAVTSVVKEDIRNSGAVRDLVLYAYTATSSAVNLTDKRAYLLTELAQSGRVEFPETPQNAVSTVNVVFAVPYDSPPAVIISAGGGNPQSRSLGADNVTATGFTAVVYNSGIKSSPVAFWQANVKTQ